MCSTESRKKKHKKDLKNKRAGNLEEGLNIRYHDVNPEGNYIISPRAIPEPIKRAKKQMLFCYAPLLTMERHSGHN